MKNEINIINMRDKSIDRWKYYRRKFISKKEISNRTRKRCRKKCTNLRTAIRVLDDVLDNYTDLDLIEKELIEE